MGKGVQGGTYKYLDADSGLAPGTWVYRIMGCDTSGVKSAMCQKLVEIESGDEQKQTLVIGVGIALLALVFVGAGLFIDPIQTTSAGRGFLVWSGTLQCCVLQWSAILIGRTW